MIVRQVKSTGSGRWFRIEALGSTYVVRPKGTRKNGPQEATYSSLAAALDHVHRDR